MLATRTTATAAARADLRRQIALLEGRLVQLAPAPGAPAAPARGPRLLTFDELAAAREALLARVGAAEAHARAVACEQEAARQRLDAMLDTPAAHRGAVIALAELGLPGCGRYRVTPRLGLIGRLAGWWQVKLSSGCPLP